jgi:hypothetical protein
MAQYLIHCEQRLKHWIRESEMCNPDRCVSKDQIHRR